MSHDNIINIIKAIQDIMRQDVGINGDAQRIEQLAWILFLKISSDKEKELELLEKGYKSPIPKEYRWDAWAANDEGITGDDLLDFLVQLFRVLKGLKLAPKPDPRAVIVKEVFEDAHNYMKSGQLLRQVVNKVNEIDFNRKQDRHQFGDIYEGILRDLQSAGNAGEYYTPRAVTQFAVDMVDPKLGEKIIDPACGTGGFLACAIEHVRSKYVKDGKDDKKLQASIYGSDKKPMPHLLCVTNMILHGIEAPSQIQRLNPLDRPLRDYGPKDRVDVVVTNPPFGGQEEPGVENNFPATLKTRETADLFLVLVMNLLNDGGRAAIVLPDGTLFGEGVKTRIKEKLLDECNLHTIVRLPKGVFSPYASIQTNILFFTKGTKTKEIWYYEHPYPQGYKSYSKTKPIQIEEFAPEKAWWKRRKETPQAWKVTIDQIRERGYNLDIKNPNTPEESHEDPDVLLKRYEEAKTKATEVRESLRKALATALEGKE